MIRVELPLHLRNLARVDSEVELDLQGPVTRDRILDALEGAYPMLRGTLRDQQSGQRRARVRFFADQKDISHDAGDVLLSERIASGAEPFRVVGAIAGG